MSALLLAFALSSITIGLVGVFYRRRLSFPKRYPHQRGTMGGLSDAEVSRVASWSREIEGEGFGDSCGEYRADVELTPGGIRQIIQHRVWLTPDRRHWAYAKCITSLEPLATTAGNTWLSAGFVSVAEDGTLLSTHNYANSDQLDRAPGLSFRRLSGVESAALLWKAHLDHVQEKQGGRPLAVQDPEGFVDLLSRIWDTKTAWARRRGYLREEGERYWGGLKLALLIGRNNINPFRMEGGKPSRVALRLILASGGTLALAVLLHQVLPRPDWELGFGALFLLLAVAIPVLFPKSQGVPFIWCSIPAHAYLEARTGYGPGILLAAVLVSSILGGWVVALRYRGSASRLRVAGSSAPRLTRLQKILAWGMLAGALGLAFGVQALMRDPRWSDRRVEGVVQLCLAGNGLLLAALLCLMMIPSQRRKRNFRIWMVVCACTLIVAAGDGIGIVLQSVDRRVSLSRMDRIKKALERFENDRGGLPDTMEQLVPDYLSELPRPVAGLARPVFEYKLIPSKGGPYFVISYRSPEGRPGRAGGSKLKLLLEDSLPEPEGD